MQTYTQSLIQERPLPRRGRQHSRRPRPKRVAPNTTTTTISTRGRTAPSSSTIERAVRARHLPIPWKARQKGAAARTRRLFVHPPRAQVALNVPSLLLLRRRRRAAPLLKLRHPCHLGALAPKLIVRRLVGKATLQSLEVGDELRGHRVVGGRRLPRERRRLPEGLPREVETAAIGEPRRLRHGLRRAHTQPCSVELCIRRGLWTSRASHTAPPPSHPPRLGGCAGREMVCEKIRSSGSAVSAFL